MKQTETIASIKLVKLSADGTSTPVRVQIGKPFHTGTEWGCPVSVEGIGPSIPSIFGEDSLQSLCLALRIVASLLKNSLKSGDRLFYEDNDADHQLSEFQLENYFAV